MKESVSQELKAAAGVALGQCLGVRPGEQVLIVTDPACLSVGQAIRQAAEEKGAEWLMMMMSPREVNGQEPPRAVAEAMRASEVCLLPVSRSLTHTVARREASEAGARIASMPGITEEIMARALGADYEAIRDLTGRLGSAMAASNEVRITTPAGTDLSLKIQGRPLIEDTGIYLEAGQWGNLPAGEVYVAPIEDSAQGRLVIDGSLAAIGVLSSPVTVEISDGRAASFSGGPEAGRLQEILDAAGPEGRNVAELGVGTNPSAKLVGNILEDEKVLGTVHVAFGANASFGGQIQVACHIDGVLLRPTLRVGKKELLSEGALKLD